MELKQLISLILPMIFSVIGGLVVVFGWSLTIGRKLQQLDNVTEDIDDIRYDIHEIKHDIRQLSNRVDQMEVRVGKIEVKLDVAWQKLFQSNITATEP